MCGCGLPDRPLIEACREHGLAAGQLTGPDGRAASRVHHPPFSHAGISGIRAAGNQPPVAGQSGESPLSIPGSGSEPRGSGGAARGRIPDDPPRCMGTSGRLRRKLSSGMVRRRGFLPAGGRTRGIGSSMYRRFAAEHPGGHSVRKLPAARMEEYWYDSLLRYAAKHFRPWPYRGVCLAAVLSTVPRTVAGIIRERNLNPVVSCFKIMRLAVRRLVSRTQPAQRSGRTGKT